jgi:hypothetical protein
VRAARAGELHGEPSHAPGGTLDQHALALAEPAVVIQALPRGERGQRDRSALGVPECSRPGHQKLGGQRRVVGGHAIAIEWCEREDLLAGP